MALIKCPECGGTVSSFADKCPHCGHPVDAEKMAAINSQPAPASQPVVQPEQAAQPIAQPAPQTASTELSAGAIGKGLMMLLSFVGIILLGVFVGKIKGNEEPTKDFVLFLTGYTFSLVSLYYIIRMFVENNGVQQFLGFVIGFSALFVEVVLLSYRQGGMSEDLGKATTFILLGGILCSMWFAGAKEDWSKIFFLTAGTLLIAGLSFVSSHTPESTEMIVYAILGGMGLFAMLVGWLVELTLQGNKAPTRFIALVEVLLILTTVIIGAITLKTLLDTHADVAERYNKMKLTMIFLLISGASSTLLSLFMPRKKFIFFASVLFLAAAMMMTLGHYREIKIRYTYYTLYSRAAYQVEDDLGRTAMNLIMAGMFFFPISILMHYVADLTKGITSRISFKMS